MPYPASVTRHDICFEIPVEEFRNLLDYEEADWRAFSLPTLSTILDGIDGVSGTEYNGHFGSNIFVTLDVDDDGETPQIAQVQRILDEHFADVRRVADIMPQLLVSGRHTIEEWAQYYRGGEVKRTMLYSDDQFLISDSMHDHTIAVFYKEGGETRMREIPRVAGILDLIGSDRHQRSFDVHKRKEITLSRDIPKVRMRIANYLSLPEPTKEMPSVAPIDVSRHFLKETLPPGAVPIYAHPLFIVADSGERTGLSVTFRSDGESGAKWFTDGARKQIIETIAKDVGSIDRWMRKQLPEDLEGSIRSYPAPR